MDNWDFPHFHIFLSNQTSLGDGELAVSKSVSKKYSTFCITQFPKEKVTKRLLVPKSPI